MPGINCGLQTSCRVPDLGISKTGGDASEPVRKFPHCRVVARLARANEPGTVLGQAADKPLLQTGDAILQKLAAAIRFDWFPSRSATSLLIQNAQTR